jgi:hypothetical protein
MLIFIKQGIYKMKKIMLFFIVATSLSAQVYECQEIYIPIEKETIKGVSTIIFDQKKAIVKSKMFDTIVMKYDNTEVNGDTHYSSGDEFSRNALVYHRRNSPYLFYLTQELNSYIFESCKRLK